MSKLQTGPLPQHIVQHLIIIGPSASACANCGGDADPNEYGHCTELQYSGPPMAGCGTTWLYSATNNLGEGVNASVIAATPGLIFIGVIAGDNSLKWGDNSELTLYEVA